MSLAEVLKKYNKCNIEDDVKNESNNFVNKNVIGRFINYHHHDEYSLRCGIGNVTEIIPLAKEYNMSHICITNYCDVSEWVRIYSQCKKNDLIPIFGIELFVNNYFPIFEKVGSKQVCDKVKFKDELINVSDMNSYQKSDVNINWHLILIAINKTGFENLIKIHNYSQLEWFYNFPRCPENILEKYGEGIVAIIPNYCGEVTYLVDNDKYDEAVQKLNYYKSIFEDVYLELSVEEDDFYGEVNNEIIDFAQKTSTKMLIGINSHYTNQDDEPVYSTLLTLRKFKGDKQHEVNVVPKMYFKSESEVKELFERRFKNDIFTEEVFNNCLINSANLANSIPFIDIDTSVKMPHFDNADEIIERKAFEGLEFRGKERDPIYIQRLRYELKNVKGAGFTDYFLFLEDMYSWCRKNNVIVGYGRGSAAGSLLLYCLRVTDVDPIQFNLLFERFLDAARLEEIISKGLAVTADQLPDVDCDINNKEAVLNYFRHKYGEENICTIGTINRFKNKSLLLDLARVNGVELQDTYKLTQGEMAEWEDNTEDMSVDELRNKYSQFNEYMNRFPQIVKPWDRLRGGIQAFGQHAGGVLVSDVPLTNLLPVKMLGGNIVSCWMEGLEDRELGVMGFVKMDLLVIDAMTITDDVLNLINIRYNKELTRDDIPFEDKTMFKIINNGDNYGIWQLDGNLGMSVVKAIGGVHCFDDLAAVSALMRPSALMNNFHVKFGKRRKGEEEYYIPKPLVPYLQNTYGLPIYQEAAYHIAYHIANFNIVDSYKFMKTLYKGKMKGDAVPYWHDKFIEGCKHSVESGLVNSDYPETAFNELLAFQGYGFNQSHAVSYAFYSRDGLWFKAHYPLEFMCVLMNHTNRLGKINNVPALVHRIGFARKIGIDVCRPSINNSQSEWIIDYDDSLRMPFIDIKNINSDVSNEIVSHQPYRNFDDFMSKIDRRKVNEAKVEQLIFSGCFDEFADVPTIWNYWNKNYVVNKGSEKKSDIEQLSLFFDDSDDDNIIEDVMFSKKQLKDKELEAIGINLNDDLVKKYKSFIEKDTQIKLMQDIESCGVKYAYVFGKISNISNFTNKNGEGCKWITITDSRSSSKIYIRDSEYYMNNTTLSKGNVCKIPVTVGSDRQTYFFSNTRDLKLLGKEE